MADRALDLLQRVQRRRALLDGSRRAAQVWLALVVVYGTLLVLARPLGLLTEWDHRWLLAVPLIAVLAALLTVRRPAGRWESGAHVGWSPTCRGMGDPKTAHKTGNLPGSPPGTRAA